MTGRNGKCGNRAKGGLSCNCHFCEQVNLGCISDIILCHIYVHHIMKRCILILLLSAMAPVFGQSARISPAAFATFSTETVQHQSVVAVPHNEPNICTVDPAPGVGTSSVVVQEELVAGRKAGGLLKEKPSLRERYQERAKRSKKH